MDNVHRDRNPSELLIYMAFNKGKVKMFLNRNVNPLANAPVIALHNAFDNR